MTKRKELGRMKKMKKILTLIVALAMVMSMMSFAAFAAEGDGETPAAATVADSTIQVTGLAAGDTVKYIQVIKWDETQGWVKAPGFENLTDEVFSEVVGSAAEPGKITDASATAIATLAANTTMLDGGTVAEGKTSWEKDGLDPGLYMVQAVPTTADVIYNPVFVAVQSDGKGGVVELPLSYDNNGTAKKSDVTVDKKTKSAGEETWAEHTSEDVGDIIDYKVEVTVPAYLENWTNPVFTVMDELSDGLTFDLDGTGHYTSLTVMVGDEELEEDSDYEVEIEDDVWMLSFTDTYLKNRTSATLVTITYQAKITSEAKTVNPETNEVTIDYSRNPSDQNDHGTKTDKTTHYTFSLDADLYGDDNYESSEIIKVGVDENGNEILDTITYDNGESHGPLEGAEFKLYKEDGITPYTNDLYDENAVFVTNGEGKLMLKDQEAELPVVGIHGLDEGTYKLVETKAPAGYVKVNDPVTIIITGEYETVAATDTCNSYEELTGYTITVNGQDVTKTSSYTIENDHEDGTVTVVKDEDGSAGDVTFPIKNVKATELPSTGGMGTTIFYIIGAILVLGAAIVLVSRRRMKA